MKKKNNMLTIVLIVLVSLTLLGLVVVIALTQFNNNKAGSGEPTIDEILVSSVDVAEITTNLADRNMIRIAFKITTDSEEAAIELTKRDFQTKNLIINELSEMTKDTLEGKQGKLALQNTLKAQLNEVMQHGEVEQVYITSYIIP